MPNDLHQIAPTTTEHVEIAGVRIALQRLLDLERQAVHPLAHVRVTGRDPHPRARAERDNRSARRTAATKVEPAPASIFTRQDEMQNMRPYSRGRLLRSKNRIRRVVLELLFLDRVQLSRL